MNPPYQVEQRVTDKEKENKLAGEEHTQQQTKLEEKIRELENQLGEAHQVSQGLTVFKYGFLPTVCRPVIYSVFISHSDFIRIIHIFS